MSIKKRSVNVDAADLSPSIMTEKTRPQSWRRFMNEIANEGAYVPTAHEHTANCLTHGCLIVPSIIAAQRLLSRSKTPAQYWSSMIYGNALIFLFSCSTIFHCSCFHPTYKDSTIKHVFHRVDRAIIYIFISASYTPWLLIRPTETISTISIVTIVWTMAILGIVYQTLYHERYKVLEICCYVVVGVFPALVVLDMPNHDGIPELAIGGLIFILGLGFFKCDGVIPFAHAIWHCFVFFGAAIHYYAISTYLIGALPSNPNFS